MQYSPRPAFAILVDADHAPHDVLKAALAEVEEEGGEATVRLVFGNGEALKGMREAANAHGFRPVLQFTLATRKNATDVSLAVTAMDLLHGGDVQGFCIVSNDCDFHPLATRLREAGRRVLGMGASTTPEPLRAACHRFIVLPDETKPSPAAPKKPEAKPAAPPAAPRMNPLHALLREACLACGGAGEWVTLSKLGSQLRVLEPDYSPKKYGKRQTGALVRDSGMFEERLDGTTSYVRLRR